ncbi:MAG: trypsin-like peptidase domain-containing protein [Thermoproteota archaeon]|nr:trypsin-like peptidase domain-containing protein [Thermoproteota archaeon]
MVIPVSEETIVNAIEKASASVVNIASVKMVQDQLFRLFPVEGIGSGVIIDSQGHILTNNHVIDNAEKLNVTFSDGRKSNAKVIGKDESTDLAVVKILPSTIRGKSKSVNMTNVKGGRSDGDINNNFDIPFSELGNSENLKVGQFVIAVGNPFGLTGGPTVTSGIISSLNRNIQFENGVMELIQTDAAINPGNSGGPLIDMAGNVIGINTAKLPYAQGIGFAIPINTAKSILKDLIERGRVVTRAWLGITTIRMDYQAARYFGLPNLDGGVLVAKVEPYSPAEYAGLRKGDMIEELDGNKIDDPAEIANYIRNKKSPNDMLALTVNRYGRTYNIIAQLKPKP